MSAKKPSWGSTASLLTVVTVLVSLGNYAYSFLIVHLMSAQDFARFSAAQGLMLVLGSGCMAAIPWAMARFIAERRDRRAEREAMHFGLVASALQGIVFALVAGVVLWRTAGVGVGVMVALSAFIGSLIAVPVGFLQGVDRLRAITAIRVLEFLVRFASGIVILLLVSRSATAALVGYPIGAIVLIAAGLSLCRSGLPPVSGEQDTIRVLARQSANLGAIQVFLSMLGALDTVAALAAHLGTDRTASYQSAALLGRIPLFLSAAIGLAAYVHVVSAKDDGEVAEKMGQAARLYALVVIPFTIACVTAPDALVHLLIPSRYGDATALLRFTAVSGAAVGWIDVVSTAHQARARFRPAIRILGAAAIAQPVALICAGRAGGIWVFASALVAVSLTAAALLSLNARVWLPRRVSLPPLVLAAVMLAAAIALHPVAPAWIGLIVVMAALALWALKAEMSQPAAGTDVTDPAISAVRDTSEPDASPAAPDPIVNPRVLIVGDSWASGLGARGTSFGKIAAARLEASAVLDLSAVSKTVADTVADAELIREFSPDLAILFCGGTESLVHPGPIVRNLIQRWGPPSWKGLTGLEPRPYFSPDPRKARRQRIASALKVRVKRLAIRLTGGGRRVPLAEYAVAMSELIALLESTGTKMVFVSMFHIDDRLFPGTGAAMAETQLVLEAAVAGHDSAVIVDIHDALDYFGDFLLDHLHLTPDGHARVAREVTAASLSLLAAGRELAPVA